jgi:proteasome lid subunit RPN8/RPN11
MSLSISSVLLNQIRDHGKEAYPYECCGLLLGSAEGPAKTVVDLRPVQNSRAESRETRYLIDPRDLYLVEKEARRRNLDVVGIYHSHPDHPARPSEFDREHAFPWYSYIIVRIAGGQAEDLTSWTLREDRSAFDGEDVFIHTNGEFSCP